MARRATWLVLLALLLGPIFGSGAVAPVFAQDGGDGTPAAVEEQTSSEETADTTDTSEEPAAEEPTAEETPAEPTATPTTEPTPTETVAPTEEATATEELPPAVEATATSQPEPSPTATTKPTKTPKATATATKENDEVSAAEATPKTTTADLTVTLSCRTDPEKITVTNNGPLAIAVRSIGSTYQPTSAEPFAVSVKVSPGKSKIFRAGANATGSFVLTKQLIFTNSVWDQEGVTVGTNVGTVTAKCEAAPPLTKDQIKITVSCSTDPEKIAITNNGELPLTIKSITTLYDPGSQEPFVMKRTVNPHSTRTWKSGEGATGNLVLTKSYIFTNSVWEKDGASVVTSVGTITAKCPKKPADPFNGAKWIEVNLSTQYLIAWQNGVRVNETYVSTGRPGFETPTGTWYVNLKLVTDDMEGCIQGECYFVPDVPWTMYFTNWGHALHGAYWHNNFGHVMSHGCVNLPVPFAEWLFYWTPYGTPVVIHY